MCQLSKYLCDSLETWWDGPTAPAPDTVQDRGEVSDRQGEKQELGRVSGLRQRSSNRRWVGSTKRQGDLPRVHSSRWALREKGWTQGWNDTEIVAGSAQDPYTLLRCRAWPGKSRGEGDGDPCSTALEI